jgi:hypothetical protein
MKKSIFVTLVFMVLGLFPASGVIVAGANGGGNTVNNTTQAQLEAAAGVPFPMYDNVIEYAGSTGLYIGYNPATRDVWVLTARHIASDAIQGSSVIIQGQTYLRQPEGPGGFGLLPGGDLRLVRYKRADLAVPSLPAIQISSSAPVASTVLVMIGRGQNRTENASVLATSSDATSTGVGTGYHWTGPNIKRWGANVIEAEFLNSFEVGPTVTGPTGTISISGVNSVSYMTDFDQPGPSGWLGSFEAQGSVGDSGGSAFYWNGANWMLSGIFSAVSGFVGQAGDTSAFGNLSILADVSSYKSEIDSALVVTLIPEPGVASFFALTGLLIFRRRRRLMLV